MENSTSVHFHFKPFQYQIPSNEIFYILASSRMSSKFNIFYNIIEYSTFKAIFIASGRSQSQEPRLLQNTWVTVSTNCEQLTLNNQRLLGWNYSSSSRLLMVPYHFPFATCPNSVTPLHSSSSSDEAWIISSVTKPKSSRDSSCHCQVRSQESLAGSRLGGQVMCCLGWWLTEASWERETLAFHNEAQCWGPRETCES